MALNETSTETTKKSPSKASSPRSDERSSFDAMARSKIATNVVVFSFLAAALLLIVNLGMAELGKRREVRLDLTQQGFYRLEDSTRALARSVDEPVQVFVVHGADDAVLKAARADIQANRPDSGLLQGEYLPLVRNLAQRITSVLSEIRELNPEIEIFTASTDDDVARTWRTELGLARQEFVNHVVFSNKARRATRSVSFYRVFDVVLGGPRPSLPRERPLVRGERVQSAIVHGLKSVVKRKRNIVYRTSGHGEVQLPGVETILQSENFELKTVDISRRGRVPDDADLLIVGSSVREWLPAARQVLVQWWRRGGRILLLQGRLAREDHIELLDDIGAALANVQVEHARHHPAGQARSVLYGWEFLDPSGRTTHPVTATVIEQRLATWFGRFRTYRTTDDYDKERVTRTLLARGGADAVAVPVVWNEGEPVARPDLGTVTGSNPVLAVAAEYRPASAADDVDTRPGRLVAFAGDEWLGARQLATGFNLANRDLFLGTVNWLTDNEGLIVATPRAFRGQIAPLDQDSHRTFRYATVFGLPILILLTGALVFLVRRR